MGTKHVISLIFKAQCERKFLTSTIKVNYMYRHCSVRLVQNQINCEHCWKFKVYQHRVSPPLILKSVNKPDDLSLLLLALCVHTICVNHSGVMVATVVIYLPGASLTRARS